MRRTKTMAFVTLRDRTGTVQAVCRAPAVADLAGVTPETAVRVYGTVRETPAVRFGPVELEAEIVKVVALADTPLPLDGRPSPEALLDYRFLALRAHDRFLVFSIQHALESAIRAFLHAHNFLEIHTPKITAGGSESGAAVFLLPYFEATACLVQSPQFYTQLAMAAGFDRVFEVGPVFRAEPAVTNRHATEFTSIDIELSWIDSQHDLMDLEEALLRYALTSIRARHGAEIERVFGVEVEVPATPIPRVAFAEMHALVPGFADDGGRLTHRGEQALSKHVRERYGTSFVFVTDYPATHRPFYTMRDRLATGGSEAATSRSFDLLWRGIEVTSGCQREHRHPQLVAQAAQAGLETAALKPYLERYYLEMFKYGCPPHGGFGLGVNRMLMALLAQQSIRDTSFVFRGPGRFVP